MCAVNKERGSSLAQCGHFRDIDPIMPKLLSQCQLLRLLILFSVSERITEIVYGLSGPRSPKLVFITESTRVVF